MTSITVMGLNDKLVERLERKAAANNRSLEEEVLHILKHAAGPGEEERAARATEFYEKIEPLLEKQRQRQSQGNIKDKPSLQIIREDRDSDHGRLYDPWGLDDRGR